MGWTGHQHSIQMFRIYLLSCMESSGGAEKLKKRYIYMFRGREGKEYWKKLYILLSCNENKSAPTECVNDDFSKNGWALWEVHSPWHLQWKSSSLWIWQDFALARKQILANISQAPVLTVFRYEIFRDRGLENGSLARVPDAGKKKKHLELD